MKTTNNMRTGGFWAFMAALCCLSSCELEEPRNPLPVGGDTVYLSMAVPEADEVVVTRATASETERVIYTVRVLAFDRNGDCFYNREVYDGYDGRIPYEPSRALGIPRQNGTLYTECTVWVMANVGLYTDADGMYDFSGVTTLGELQDTYAYRILQEGSSPIRECLPMIGVTSQVNMTQPTSVGNPLQIDMKRAFVRVNFHIDVKAGLEFYFNEWSVEGLPRYTYVVDHGAENDFADIAPDVYRPYSLFYPSTERERALVTKGIGKWLTSGSDIESGGFYMYENRRGGRLPAPNPGNLQGDAATYAARILDLTDPSGSDPRFKTLYAPENASFLILSGLIRETATQNISQFSYKIALGGNNTNDYSLLRNHSYTYNIHINGITYDDISVDAFDSRVHRDYALQISAPESQRMDAHYDKRYLDITASPGTVELQLYPTEADARAGTNPILTKDWIAISEMDTYNIDIDSDEGPLKSWEFADIERKRYYIYTEENLSAASRSVVLKITHTPNPSDLSLVQDPVIRYYTYQQAGVIESNGFYVEQYEEYGMNLDVYDPQSAVSGLPWGWGIVKSGNTVVTAYDFTTTISNTSSGLFNTPAILSAELQGDAFDGVDVESIYNNYAARYCDNKNKRDALGNVIDRKWFLPSIDELKPISAAVADMAGKEYWSSTVPQENDVRGIPPWWIFGEWVWNIFVGDFFSVGNEYEFRNVARAAEDGAEQKETLEKWVLIKYTADACPPRDMRKHVRAVRIME